MIEQITLRMADKEYPTFFELGFFDLDKKEQKHYFRTTRYGTEVELRPLLHEHGVAAPKIEYLFTIAKTGEVAKINPITAVDGCTAVA
ncbi:MAG: hypothetical protein ABSH39_21510 [Candidatus Acidiferrum sp.]